MSGLSGSVVTDHTPSCPFCIGPAFVPSQRSTTSFALGARRRKVTRPSAWTSGDTSVCAEAVVAAVISRTTGRFVIGISPEKRLLSGSSLSATRLRVNPAGSYDDKYEFRHPGGSLFVVTRTGGNRTWSIV